MATCKTCGAPVNLAPDGDPKYEAPPTLRAQLAEAHAKLAVAVGALRLHQAWADSEDAGPNYGGQTRATHPDGERIWREWWDGNLSLCARANETTKHVLSTLPAQAAQMLAVIDAARNWKMGRNTNEGDGLTPEGRLVRALHDFDANREAGR